MNSNLDVDEGETFTTSGDSSQEIKRTLDTKVISAFEISPFDDKVSKEFQIGCEIGEFKLGKINILQRCLGDNKP